VPSHKDLLHLDLVSPDLVSLDLVNLHQVSLDLVSLDLVSLDLVSPDLVSLDLVSPDLVGPDLVSLDLVGLDPGALDLTAVLRKLLGASTTSSLTSSSSPGRGAVRTPASIHRRGRRGEKSVLHMGIFLLNVKGKVLNPPVRQQ